jgi:dTDP-4-dehydrorhamnose reductase
MKKKRVLITGGSGLLAINWACAIRDDMHVTLAMHHHSVELRGVKQCNLDLTDLLLLEEQIHLLAPDIIVHTAGLTNVETCEKNPSLAFHVNAEIASNIGLISSKYNIKFIHISTDHLFSHSADLYTEDSMPQPVNEYAKSKLLAEELVIKVNQNAIIVRTNFFCWGYSQRQSFSDWIIYSLRAGKKLLMFDDVHITPILADSLANLAHELAELRVSGVFNVAGDEKISKYDFSIRLAKAFNLPVNNIERSSLSNSKLLAMRPNNMALDNSKVSKILSKKIGGLDIFFSTLHSQELNGRAQELFNAVS